MKRVNELLLAREDKTDAMRLKGIEEKLNALESAYRYLQADVAECKRIVSEADGAKVHGKNGKKQ